MPVAAALSLALLLPAGPAAKAVEAGRTAFTLEQVMSAPFPTELTAATTGGAVAWVFNARGVRNVWVAEPPDYRGRAVTSYAQDDGQELSDLQFSGDGRTLVYVRGSEPNHAGEIPNPRSDPAGAAQAVYSVPAAGGQPRRLGDGASPAVSPRGDRVAFVWKEKVWWAPLDGSEKAAEAFVARGVCGNLRWSPDGSLLAFVSRRGDHSFIGIFDPAGKTVRYLDPTFDRDQEPAWSPDGRRVAFLRIPSSPGAREVLRPHREGPPWSIRVAELATSGTREAFRAEAGRGSVFREIVSKDQLLWAGNDRLVFPWEKDGWTHLYAVPASGGAPTLLTPGAFEVEEVRLSSDRRTVFYSSNQDDIERRHLWSVAAEGGRPSALTSGSGLEWSPVPAGDGKTLAFVRADARRHPSPVIRVGGAAERELAPGSVPREFPEASLVVPETVTFPAADGLTIHAQLFKPADLARGRRRPAVIFFHGGSQRQMLPGWHYMYYYRNAYAMNQYLASRGILVLSVNYRSGIGYGMEFREALDYGAEGASEYRDVTGAALYLRGLPDVDAARIGLWGGSYGGYLTALGLARNSDLFAAGVDMHGVHDWSAWFRVVLGEDARNADAARVAFQSSPMADVKSWRSPVLLIHGDDDRNVPFHQSVDLADALRAQGVAVEQLVFPDEIHDFLLHASWVEAYRRGAEFLERRLAVRPPEKNERVS
ncbi:MAG: prolyl oligopeptidase family serine peptidase [Acidobacteriota bacterium]